nr:MAG TPA: hypothetical protein [Caudoviricetes sp.]
MLGFFFYVRLNGYSLKFPLLKYLLLMRSKCCIFKV